MSTINPSEIVGIDMEEERKRILVPEYSGLGPPDLVVVMKDVDGILYKNYHQVYGISYKSQSGFIEYFQKFVADQTKIHNVSNIRYGYVLTWDSIWRQDVCIPSYQINFAKKPNWFNLHISSVLRFYRHDSSLLYSIYGGIPYVYLPSVTQPLFEISLEDLEYAADLFSMFSMTMEHQLAISRALLCNCNTPQIMKFLYAYSNSLPAILVHISKILPPSTAIEGGVYFLLETHLDTFCDDLEAVFAVFTYYLNHSQPQKCKRYIPLLEQTKFHHPLAAICLARYYISTKTTSGYNCAFHCLNIAGLAKGWSLPGLTPDVDPKYLSEVVFPTSHTKLEKLIVDYPVTGRTQAYFDAINELIDSYSEKTFTRVMNIFMEQHPFVEKEPNFPEYPFFYSDSCKSTDEFYLFDPGIETEPIITPELRNVPMSHRFYNMIQMVLEGRKRLQKLTAKLYVRDSFKSTDLLLALRFKDGVVFNVVYEYLKRNNKLTGAGYLLVLRAILLGIVNLDSVAMPNILTADQASVIPFAKGFIEKLVRLERVYL
ncbi:hypothetical protein TVAG_307880 [Trichomonas vaginalis G3]|uniref:Uncharacterized protein n=1 Tax=Trichomonas vaginalis (strain ATCC PRA-98 / G3) TaxID=412133 RepID=A2F441_TRIV3|nr:hypothetical protein TVAGG3_0688030 [Trichomonas vaginalis G3]EAY00342.1 hypothetical protein TVAG_307880 [Trichomonas vaginalis G3]KAI5508365.1 hypothetical protein TVAGG3_0688030 [Trichomonas vaginalis G3]|eukprot:XP_001313271.1 hypothetical protein [Trichomonas vaginalis G3]